MTRTRVFAALALGAALLLVFAPAPPAGAQHCAVRPGVVTGGGYVTPTYNATATYDPVVIAQFVAVPVAVPLVGAGYDDGKLAALKAELDAVRKQNDTLLQLLKGPAQPPVAAPPKAPPVPTAPVPTAPVPTAPTPKDVPQAGAAAAHPGLGVMVKSCAACHDAATKAKGGGLALLAGGQLSPGLTPQTRLAGVRSLLAGTMPRGNKISDEEITQVIDLLSQ